MTAGRTVVARGGLLAIVLALSLVYAFNELHLRASPMTPAGLDAGVRVLFIGNSFVNHNDLPSLVEPLLEQARPDWGDVYVASVAVNGARFADHVEWLEDPLANAPIRQALVTWPPEARRWTYVVLQEQSQLHGLEDDNPNLLDSMWRTRALTAAAQRTGATVVLLNTWGFWDGDGYEPNRELYPDFLTMNARLRKGAQRVVDDVATVAPRPGLVPVGAAFERVYDDERALGLDPLRPGSRFRSLYTDDRHPSLRGSYVMAVVLAQHLAGHAELNWRPPTLPAAEAELLRRAARSP